jgi:hypothetical protein
MKRIGLIVAALLFGGPNMDQPSHLVRADNQHGNYVPPYAEEDPRNDPEYDHETEDDKD